MLKVAVFGCGYWAKFQIAAWQAAGAAVAAVWNRTGEKALSYAKEFSIPRVFETSEALFEWGEFDIADIITGVEAHEPLVLMAASCRKPVICQKPMSSTLESCRRMVKACADAGVWFAVHENFRYQPPVKKFIDTVKSGVAGKILHAQINMRSPDLAIMEKQPALRSMPHMVLRDMGPHIFDVARAAFGEIERIHAVPVYSYTGRGIKIPDSCISTLVAHNGAVISCNLVHNWNDHFFAEGERGFVRLDCKNCLHVQTNSGETVINTETWEKLPYIPTENWNLHGGHVFTSIPACLEDLKNSFLGGIPAPTSGEDNLKTMELVFAAIKSFDTGGVICV